MEGNYKAYVALWKCEQSFAADRFRPKSNLNPRNKDVIIETYLSCFEERLLDTEIPSKIFNKGRTGDLV